MKNSRCADKEQLKEFNESYIFGGFLERNHIVLLWKKHLKTKKYAFQKTLKNHKKHLKRHLSNCLGTAYESALSYHYPHDSNSNSNEHHILKKNARRTTS